MRSCFPMFTATLFTLLAASAGAQTQATPSTAPVPPSQVQVMAPLKPAQVWHYEVEAISGAYALSNGWRLKVSPASNGIVAQIDKRRPMRLLALSPDRYVSRDGNVWMEFNRGKYGDDMVMSYVPDARMAQVIVVKATLAQRYAQ